MEDLASDEAISAVITEFLSSRNDQEEEKSDLSEEEEEAAVLPAPLASPADQPEAGPSQPSAGPSQSSLGSDSDRK